MPSDSISAPVALPRLTAPRGAIVIIPGFAGLLFGSDPSFRLSARRRTLPRSGDTGDRRSRSRSLDAGRKTGAYALSILAYFGGR
jgi:hypothetical protein